MDPRAASRGGGGADRRPGGRRGGRGPGAAAEHRARRGVRRARVDGRPGGRCGGRRGMCVRPAPAAVPAAAADAADAAGAGCARTSPTTAGCRPSAPSLRLQGRRASRRPGASRRGKRCATRARRLSAREPTRRRRRRRPRIARQPCDGRVRDGGDRARAREQQREGGGSCSASLDAAGAACADPVNRASLARKMSAANGLLARRTSGATSSTEEVTTHAPPPLNEKRQSHFGASAKVAPAADADGPRRVSEGMRRLCSMRFPGARAAARGRRRRPPPSRRRRHQSRGTVGGSRHARALSRRAPSAPAAATVVRDACFGAARSLVR